MNKKKGYPKKGDLVIVKIKKVMPYGAFAELEEFENIEGFLHISEVASKWIKNIGDYVKVGQRTVAKVLSVDEKKSICDISIRRVSEDDKKKRLKEFENERKAEKIIKAAIKQAKSRKKPEKIIESILNVYETLYDFALDVYDEGESILNEFDIPDKVKKNLAGLIRRAFKPPIIKIKKIVTLTVYEPNGIETIKKVLTSVQKSGATVKLLGAPRYMIEVEDTDVKKAVKKMNKAISALEKGLKGVTSNYSIEDAE